MEAHPHHASQMASVLGANCRKSNLENPSRNDHRLAGAEDSIYTLSRPRMPAVTRHARLGRSRVADLLPDAADPWPHDEAIGSSGPRKRRQRRREDLKEHPGEEEEKQHCCLAMPVAHFPLPAGYT
jgi:hypothetical protein